MVLSTYSLFKVNIQNLVRDKVSIVKEYYIQPSEIDRMPFWEYEMFKEEIMKQMKERQEHEERQRADYGTDKFSPDKYKLPKQPQIKAPSMSMPKTNFKM